jgi:hypothetical protein
MSEQVLNLDWSRVWGDLSWTLSHVVEDEFAELIEWDGRCIGDFRGPAINKSFELRSCVLGSFLVRAA